MSFFDEDDFFEGTPFEEFFKKRQAGSQNRFTQGEQEERVIDYIEEKDLVYLVFELPGYDGGDVSIEIKGNEIQISAIKENATGMKPAIAERLKKGTFFRKTLPAGIKKKNYEETVNNGVLEIKFKRK